MKFVNTLLICLLSLSPLLSQSKSGVNYDKLLIALKQDIPNGQHRTLRDLISLLNHQDIAPKVRKILKNSTFFLPTETDVLTADKATLLQFYYDHSDKIQYSEILNAFYITPIEQRKVDFELKQDDENLDDQGGGALRRLLSELDTQLESQKYDKAVKSIEKIIQLNLSDLDVYLNILRDPRLLQSSADLQKKIYQSLLTNLQNSSDIEVVEIALQMLEGEFLEVDFVDPFLLNITNNAPEPGIQFETNAEYYQFLVDSLGSLEEIRKYGYERVFNFRMNFFQFPVDYYGKILSLSDDYPWIKQNIIFELKQSQHPRAFFYLASDWYRHWKEFPGTKSEMHKEAIFSLTNVKIGVKDKNDKITFSPWFDEVAMNNFFLFWASNYTDFEWDDNRNLFSNKLETLAKTQNYERLFRRLNSRNDTIALESFVQLCEGEPIEIKTLAKKYRQLLRNQNGNLPSLKHKYLEQLSLLTDFCKQNNFSYKVKPRLAQKLLQLIQAETASEKFTIENEIIESIGLDDITALEFWACLKEGNKDISFSTGRILDWVYSNNWNKVLNDKNQLRLYLKKSYLLENIGVGGVCNAYLNKFDVSNPAEQELLEQVGRIESDDDILNQLSLLLSSDQEQDQYTFSITDFLEDPLAFNKRDLKILPKPSISDVKQIVEQIKKEQEPEVIKKMFYYLWLHPDIVYIPTLFTLIDDNRIITKREKLTISVADNIIPIVENVYGHSFERSDEKPFATEEWASLWKTDSPNYENWAVKFFERKLDSLDYFETIKIDQLNALTESDFYSEKYKTNILKHLKKVKPIRNIRRLSIEPKLSVEEDIKFFEDFFFRYKELDDIPKLFDISEASVEQMLLFINRKAESYEISEKGSLYNNLFRSAWLSRHINQGKLDPELATIIEKALKTYLNESEFLSEFEEQVTQLNIAKLQFMGLAMEEKIEATLTLTVDNESKAKILNSIISTISYDQISVIVGKFDRIAEALGDNTCAFLSKDFGIPVFSFNSNKELEQFIRNHGKMSEAQFYFYYLKKFGLDFCTKKEELDYQKIYNILRFDIVSPFVGETGGKRDWYIYGVIKLLELHFDTRLGFHEKLNESQTFYSFSSSKRAQAWLNYLKEQQLINSEVLISPSFNLVRDES